MSVLQDSFHEAILTQLKQLLKRHKASSALYRAAFSAHTEYLEELEEVFPWISEAMEEGGASAKKGEESESSTEEKKTEGVKVEPMKADATQALPVELDW